MARTHRTAVVPAHKEHCFTHVSPGSFTVAASVQADKRPRIAPSCADVGRTTRCPVDLSAGRPWTSFNSPSRRDLDRYHHRHLGLLDLETRQHFLRGSIYARHGSFRTTPGPLSRVHLGPSVLYLVYGKLAHTNHLTGGLPSLIITSNDLVHSARYHCCEDSQFHTGFFLLWRHAACFASGSHLPRAGPSKNCHRGHRRRMVGISTRSLPL